MQDDAYYHKEEHVTRAEQELHWYGVLEGFAGVPHCYGSYKSEHLGMEVLRLQKLRPNLVEIFGCDAGNAKRLLARGISKDHVYEDAMNPVPDLVQFWDLAHQAACILALMQDRYNVAHRDVKPENMCLDDAGNLYVIDLEYCAEIPRNRERRETDSRDVAWRTLKGTRAYCAPEIQCEGARIRSLNSRGTRMYDERCDTWSFGVTLLELYGGVDFNSELMMYETQDEIDNCIGTLVHKSRTKRSRFEWTSARFLQTLLGQCLRLRYEERPYMRDVVLKLAEITDEALRKRTLDRLGT